LAISRSLGAATPSAGAPTRGHATVAVTVRILRARRDLRRTQASQAICALMVQGDTVTALE